MPACASRSSSRSSCRSRTWAASARSIPLEEAPGGPPRRAGGAHLASGPRSTRASWSSSARIAAPSSSPTAAASPSASRSSSTSWPGRSWPGPTTARSRASSGCSSRSALKAGPAAGHRGHVARSSWASTWAPWTSSSRSSRRSRWPAGCSASAAPATRSASRPAGVIFPKYRGDLLETAVVTRLMHEGAIETTVVPRNPLDVLAQQLVAMTLDARLAGRRALRAGPRGAENYAELGRRGLRGDAGHARRPVPGRRVRGAAAAPRLGPRGRARSRRAATRARSRSPPGGTIPDRGLFPVFLADDAPPGRRPGPGRAPGRHAAVAAASASWTRRWSTRRARARSSCWAPAPGASRPSSTTACSSRPAPGPARQGALLEGRRRRPARRAGPGPGRLHARDVAAAGLRPGAAGRRRRDGSGAPRPRRPGGRQPAGLPGGGAGRHGRPAHGPHDRAAAVPGRAGRLADLPAEPLRRPCPRALGAGHRGAAARGARRGGAAHLVRRRHRRPPAGHGPGRGWPGSREAASGQDGQLAPALRGVGRRRRGGGAHRRPTRSRSW